ncbi:WRKY transcription factor 22-like [Gossypium arboreum]|uniref:WRKY transcription factor 22-like n=1 Tax=Gossypium arboreum TaxID=29729 RepID=UPI00081928B5|nr:WRKY transcription factor 22-like [Gossypium arboreum]
MTSNFNMEHWDWQAVTGETCSNNDAFFSYMENPEFSFGPLSFQHGDEDHLMSFPKVFEPNPNVLDELMEELYKPFCPELNPYTIPVLEDHAEEPECQKQQPLVVSGTNKDSTKPKRSRKKQQHRVVKHVTGDAGLQSDIWSWRKYGQKPIKGSPYPRSYYRCSSSKGCLARKQVERSCSDPRVFIITYTAEHNHGHPTRRTSLAGSTRNKSLTVAKPKNLAYKNEPHEVAESTVLSPAVIKDESVKQESITMEGGKILTPDVMLSDELVESFEGFGDLFVDQFPDLSHELWSMNESATLTGGLLN